MTPLRLDVTSASEQRLTCAHRPRCLMVAAKARWPGMSCAGCTSFAALAGYDLEAELDSLARFGMAIARLAVLP